MNRRDFSLGAAAACAAPAIPVSASSAPVSVARVAPVGTAATGQSQFMYGWAAQAARAGGITTAADLAAKIQVHPALAQQLFARLLQAGIITVPTTGATRFSRVLWDATGAETEDDPNGDAV